MKRKLILSVIAFTSAVFFAGHCLFASDASLDPFGAVPKGSSPGCKPEDRYKFMVRIDSKEDFIRFIRDNGLNHVELTNFKDADTGMVDWERVSRAVKVKSIGERTVYILRYNPHPWVCSKYTLKMTDDGYVSVYGCCGN